MYRLRSIEASARHHTRQQRDILISQLGQEVETDQAALAVKTAQKLETILKIPGLLDRLLDIAQELESLGLTDEILQLEPPTTPIKTEPANKPLRLADFAEKCRISKIQLRDLTAYLLECGYWKAKRITDWSRAVTTDPETHILIGPFRQKQTETRYLPQALTSLQSLLTAANYAGGKIHKRDLPLQHPK